MEEVITNEYEQAEVVCGDCIGQMQLVRVNRTTPKLFTPVFFHTLVLHCIQCNKIGKQFLKRVENQ
jgi:hypothetical protein